MSPPFAGTILRFRQTAPAAAIGAVLVGAASGAILAMYMVYRTWFPPLVVLLPPLGVSILAVGWSWRSRTDVSANGLVIGGLLRIRRVPWADVSDLVHAPNGRRIRARLTSGRAVTLPGIRLDDLHRLRAVAAGSATAVRPTVVTRGGWGLVVIVLASYLALGLATWSAMIQGPAPMRWASGETVMMLAGGWPFAFLYDDPCCSGPDDLFKFGPFLLDAAILGALPALALGAITFRRRRL